MCSCFRFSYKSALVVTRILMAILISHQLTIGLKSELGGSFTVRWKQCAGATLGVLVRPLADLQRLPPGFPSPERPSPNGSKKDGTVAIRPHPQKRLPRSHKTPSAHRPSDNH